MSHQKYVELNEDGTYNLTLNVSGAVGSSTTKQQVDVVYVLDVSGSMAYNMNSDSGSSNARLNNAKEAIKTLTDTLAANENIDAQYALVTFSGNNGRHDGAWDDA